MHTPPNPVQVFPDSVAVPLHLILFQEPSDLWLTRVYVPHRTLIAPCERQQVSTMVTEETNWNIVKRLT